MLAHVMTTLVHLLFIYTLVVTLGLVEPVAARRTLLWQTSRPHRDLQQSSYYLDCPKTPPAWQPVCQKAGSARVSFQGDTVHWEAATSTRWGNNLSPYWQARGLAQLSGYAFETEGFNNHWLQYLPKKVPGSSCPQPALLEEVCAMCDHESWKYSHRCASAWPYIRPTIINDTHNAFEAWAVASSHTLPAYNTGDVVVQSRCAWDTILLHEEYGPVAFSFYDDIPSDAQKIYIVTDLTNRPEACRALHQALQRRLQTIRPSADITTVSSSVATDFARLLYAPILFKDASSSFGLWAAVANMGQVWSTPLPTWYSGHNPSPYLGLNWHWSSAPVLYPHVAQRLNLTLENIEGIVEWLESN